MSPKYGLFLIVPTSSNFDAQQDLEDLDAKQNLREALKEVKSLYIWDYI